jgi:hypothetical protein
MAYINQTIKKDLTPEIKRILDAYRMKATISISNGICLVVTIRSGPIDFKTDNRHVNTYWLKENYEGVARYFLTDLLHAMWGVGTETLNHDYSDSQSDYFDVGWYCDIIIGTYDKPYIQKEV